MGKGIFFPGVTVGLTLLVVGIVLPAKAELKTGSSLSLMSLSTDEQAAKLHVSIQLELTGQYLFHSGTALRLLPQPLMFSTPVSDRPSMILDFGVNQNWQDQRINVSESGGDFATAYADRDTVIQDLPLTATGEFKGELPRFIQNIWLKTADGQRQPVSFTLKSLRYDPAIGQAELTGVFVEADGTTSAAKGSLSGFLKDNCMNAYVLQIEVDQPTLTKDAPPIDAPSIADSPLGSGASPGGGGGGFFPFLALFGLPFLLSGGSDNNSNQDVPTFFTPIVSQAPTANPTASPSPRPGPSPTPTPTPTPDGAVPTPALLPGAIALMLKLRQRQQSE